MEFFKKSIENPWHFAIALWSRGLLNWLPDKAYLKLLYRGFFNKKLDLKNPRTFNEKLQWLKLYDRNPMYTKMVDKYEAKEYVSSKIGSEYVIPTLGVWDRFDDIDFDKLPDQFVLKCTHDSGGLVIVKDKSKFDKIAAKAKIEKCLKYDFYKYGREWPYKNVKHRIIAEKYMEDSGSLDLKDYKFFSFNGLCMAMFIATDRQNTDTETKFDFFDANGNHLDLVNIHPNAEYTPKLPENFEKMKELAAVLSKDIPQLRVDFYEVNGDIYFGELTFAHGTGFEAFYPESWDYKFGEWIKLPESARGGVYS